MNMQLHANRFFMDDLKNSVAAITKNFHIIHKEHIWLPLKMTFFSPVRFTESFSAVITRKFISDLFNRSPSIHSVDSPGYFQFTHAIVYLFVYILPLYL